jgi:hypothetical protein
MLSGDVVRGSGHRPWLAMLSGDDGRKGGQYLMVKLSGW